MTTKPMPDDELHKALEQHQQQSRKVDRILWIVLPIFAFFLSAVFANWNIPSFFGTFIVLTLAFVSVGIKRKSLAVTLTGVLLYCLVDNYLSYKLQFSVEGLKRQLLCMVLFTAIIGLMRPLIDRSLTNYLKQKNGL